MSENVVEGVPPLDLCIVCLHPAGGVKSSLYQLWRGLRRRGVEVGLVTDLSGFGIEDHSTIVDLAAFRNRSVGTLVDSLSGVEFRSLYVYNVYSLPYLLPLVEDARTMFHAECWREELFALLSLFQGADRRPSVHVDRSDPAYRKLLDHELDANSLPEIDDEAFLDCYGTALRATDDVAALVAEDVPLVEQLAWNAGWDGDGVEHLPPLVDTSLFRPEGGPPPGAKRLLVAGRKTDAGNAKRNLAVSSNVLREEPGDWELLVLGTGDGDSLVGTTHEEYLEECTALDGVSRLPRVPFDEVPSLYNRSDVYLLLSEANEGFSVSTLEAMACGCVPIVSPFVARRMADLPRPGVNCLVAGTERGVAECARKLFDDPDRLRRMQEAAVATVRRRFSMDRLDDYEFFRRLGRDG